MHCFGLALHNSLTLLMGDGKEYQANYCRMSNLIYGLKDLFSEYKVTASFFIFFHYLGQSRFYITLFSPLRLDICNGNPNKLPLQQVDKLVVANNPMCNECTEVYLLNFLLCNVMLMISVHNHNE